MLADRLGSGYAVIEEGMNGRTTAFTDRIEPGVCALDYLYSCMISQFPLDAVVLMLGTNDSKDRYGVNAVEIGYGLDEVLLLIRSVCGRKGQTPRLLVVSPAHLQQKEDWIEFSERSVEKVSQLAGEYRLTAGRYGADFLDADGVVGADGIGCDGIHFSRTGHRRMAEKMVEYINQIKL